MVDQVSIRIDTEDHERLIALSGRLTIREKKRISLAETVAELLDKYPSKKSRK